MQKLKGPPVHKKFDAPKNPLEEEKALQVLKPPDDWAEDQMVRMATDFARQNPNSPGAQRAAMLVVAQARSRFFENATQKEYMRGFFKFLLGKQDEPERSRTPWGAQPLTSVPGVADYIDLLAGKRQYFKLQIQLLKNRVPRNLEEAYVYYKYIVLQQDDPSYLDDWDVLMGAFDANPYNQGPFDPEHPYWPRPYWPFGNGPAVQFPGAQPQPVVFGGGQPPAPPPPPPQQQPPAGNLPRGGQPFGDGGDDDEGDDDDAPDPFGGVVAAIRELVDEMRRPKPPRPDPMDEGEEGDEPPPPPPGAGPVAVEVQELTGAVRQLVDFMQQRPMDVDKEDENQGQEPPPDPGMVAVANSVSQLAADFAGLRQAIVDNQREVAMGIQGLMRNVVSAMPPPSPPTDFTPLLTQSAQTHETLRLIREELVRNRAAAKPAAENGPDFQALTALREEHGRAREAAEQRLAAIQAQMNRQMAEQREAQQRQAEAMAQQLQASQQRAAELQRQQQERENRPLSEPTRTALFSQTPAPKQQQVQAPPQPVQQMPPPPMVQPQVQQQPFPFTPPSQPPAIPQAEDMTYGPAPVAFAPPPDTGDLEAAPMQVEQKELPGLAPPELERPGKPQVASQRRLAQQQSAVPELQGAAGKAEEDDEDETVEERLARIEAPNRPPKEIFEELAPGPMEYEYEDEEDIELTAEEEAEREAMLKEGEENAEQARKEMMEAQLRDRRLESKRREKRVKQKEAEGGYTQADLDEIQRIEDAYYAQQEAAHEAGRQEAMKYGFSDVETMKASGRAVATMLDSINALEDEEDRQTVEDYWKELKQDAALTEETLQILAELERDPNVTEEERNGAIIELAVALNNPAETNDPQEGERRRSTRAALLRASEALRPAARESTTKVPKPRKYAPLPREKAQRANEQARARRAKMSPEQKKAESQKRKVQRAEQKKRDQKRAMREAQKQAAAEAEQQEANRRQSPRLAGADRPNYREKADYRAPPVLTPEQKEARRKSQKESRRKSKARMMRALLSEGAKGDEGKRFAEREAERIEEDKESAAERDARQARRAQASDRAKAAAKEAGSAEEALGRAAEVITDYINAGGETISPEEVLRAATKTRNGSAFAANKKGQTVKDFLDALNLQPRAGKRART